MNEFYKTPVIVHVMNIRPHIKETMVFLGDVPIDVSKAVEQVHRKWQKNQSINNTTLKSFYGSEWKTKLGFIIKPHSIGADELIEDEILDLGDELDQIDLFDVVEKPIVDQKDIMEQPAEEKEDIQPISKKTQGRKLIFVTNVAIYPEDKISEFKDKLYLANGKIPAFKQHLYFLLRNNAIPMYYRITVDGASVPVNITHAFGNIKESIMDLPVDRSFYEMREDIKVEARDQFTTLDDIYQKFATNTFYLLSIDEFILPKKGPLESLIFSDKYQLELLYYSFVMKYWPLITLEVFDTYMRNEKEMSDIYPDLLPSKGALMARYDAERKILKHKYELLDDSQHGYKKYPKFKAYYPEFTMMKGSSPPSAVVSVSIKNAILTIGRERVYTRARFGETMAGHIKIDVRNLFDELRISEDIPLIKVKLLRGRSPFILTKVRDPNYSTGENIRAIFEQVKYQIQLPYYNTILLAIRARDKNGRIIKASQGISKYILLVLYDNGKYLIRSVWNEDEKMDFQKIYDVLEKTTTPVINSINRMGRLVFSSAEHLSRITHENSEFTDLSLSLFWKRSLNTQQYNAITKALQDEFASKIIEPTENTDVHSGTEYTIHKGITGYDLSQLEKYISISNYYMYLSDSAVKQKWVALFNQGRAMSFTHRTTDVKVEVQGIKDSEFKYFYHYIIAFLYRVGIESKTVPIKEKNVIPSMKAGTKINTLRLLKSKDPEAFIFKKYGSDVVYSRICQKDHQPIPFSPDELKLLPNDDQKRAVKFINYTTNSDMYYLCRKGKYPYLSFIVGQHPKNYCLPCCKKTPAYTFSADLDNKAVVNKKERVYQTCLENHEYIEQDEESSASRYVMNYGKDIYIGRIGRLPDMLQQYLLYNLENTDIISEFTIARTFIMNGKKYSVDRLFKITKNIKIHKVPVADLVDHLNEKSWENKKEGIADISPIDVIENPDKNRKYTKHYGRILNADMQYPILVYRNKEEGWNVIVDGLHRLSRAYMEKHPTIKVRYVTEKQLDKVFITEDLDTVRTAEEGTIGVRKTPPVSIQKTLTEKRPGTRRRNRKKVKRKTGGAVDEKKPGYYLYGVPQNGRNTQNIGVLFSLAIAFNMDFEEFITFTIRVLKGEPNYFQILLNGELTRYFSSSKELVLQMTESFLSNKTLTSTQFTRWNELFIDIARVCYDKTVIIFDDTSIITTGTSMKVSLVNDINLILPTQVRYLEDIIPDPNTPRDYILLLQRRKKSKSAFEKLEKVYYPIFIFVPYTFFKSQIIEKCVYTQNDEIMKLVKGMIAGSLEEKFVTTRIQSDIDFNIILEFLANDQYYIAQIFVNSKDMCYAVVLQEKKTKHNVYVPVSYSYYGGGVKYFAPGKNEEHVVRYNVFNRNKYRLTPSALKSFIEGYNKFIVKKSKMAGLIKTVVEDDATDEERIIPIYPLIKGTHILILGDKPGQYRGAKHSVIGLASNNMHYYLTDLSGANIGKFYKVFSSGYKVFTFNPKKLTEESFMFMYYDPTTVNSIIAADPTKLTDRRHSLLNMAIYNKHLYKMFVIEFIRYFDKDRNSAVRSTLIGGTNFKKANSLQMFREKLEVILAKSPNDLLRVQEQVNVFYNTHFDKKLLQEEIQLSVYQFDRMALVQIFNEAENYWARTVGEQQKQRDTIRGKLQAIAKQFIKIGTPKFTPDHIHTNILASCQDAAVSKQTVYCSSQKLLMPQKKFDEYLDLFTDDLLNPIKSPYIMALIFMENVLDEFTFKRIPGEEIYIKF